MIIFCDFLKWIVIYIMRADNNVSSNDEQGTNIIIMECVNKLWL